MSNSPLKSALISSYSAQIYTAFIGVVLTPVYLRYLGTEAFGLIGFFTMLQTWLALLDFGLSPTLSRQMACYQAGTLPAKNLMDLLRTLEWLFGVIAILTVLAGSTLSPWLADKWLQLDRLNPGEVALCIALMAVMCGTRWMTNVYRSGVVGLEKQSQANLTVALIATLKFVGVVPLLVIAPGKPIVFFAFEAFAAIVESLAYRNLLYRFLAIKNLKPVAKLSNLKSILPFAGSLALSTTLWIVVVNLDKLLLSHFLSLQNYGYFSVAATVAGGIVLLITPVAQVIQPRMTILFLQSRSADKVELFREASQFMACLMAALSMNVAIFAEPLLLAWTGDNIVASQAGPTLFWYALGNGIVGILTLPYIVQHATGNLRLHVIGNVAFIFVQVPCIVYAAYTWGGYGTGVVWFLSNLIFLLFWMPVIFHRYLKGLFLTWIWQDIVSLWLAASIPCLLLSHFMNLSNSRPIVLGQLFIFGLISILCGFLAGSRTRLRLLNTLSAPSWWRK